MKKLSIFLTAICLIVVLALTVSATNILGSQTKLQDDGVSYDWNAEETPIIIFRMSGWNANSVNWAYFGDPEKPGSQIKLAAGMPMWQSLNLVQFPTLNVEYLMDMTDGFEVTIEDIEWDTESNTAIAITIGNDVGANNRTNLTCAGAMTLVVRKDGTAALYNNKSGNWYGEAATYVDKAAITAGATSFTYSMEKVEGGYSFYVNDTLLYTFNADNAAEWPEDLANSVDALGFNFLGMNGTLSANDGNIPGSVVYSVVAVDDMVKPEGGEDVPPLGDNVGAIVALAVVAGGAILAFSKKKAH